MKIITHTVLLMALHLTVAKQFEECEFANELYSRHHIPREDIYKHLCIATSLDTNRAGDMIGIYGIGRRWWCGEYAPSGGCNIKCSDLLDDDIADDVACASLILSQQGLEAWFASEWQCKGAFAQTVDECLGTIDDFTTPTEPEEWTEYVTRSRPITNTPATTEKWIVPNARATPTTTTSANQIRSIFFLIIAVAGIGAIVIVWFKNRNNL